MNQRLVKWFAFFCFCFGISLIIQLPASLLTNWISQASQGQIKIADPSGSIWNGHGALLVNLPQRPTKILGGIDWRIRLNWQEGEPVLKISGIAPGPWQVHIGQNTTRLQLNNLSLPASLLLPALLGKTLSPDWKGNFTINEANLQTATGKAIWRGSLKVRWNDWGHPSLSPNSLGIADLSAESPEANTWHFKIASQGEAGVNIQGQGRWSIASGDKNFLGNIHLPDEEKARLEPLLRSLGHYQAPTLEIGSSSVAQ